MSFDLAEIKDQASAALKENNVEEARGAYMAAIMDVGDCMMSMDEDEDGKKEVLSYAVKLWISYAEMEISLRQWKKAVAVYDDAIADQFVCTCGLIYKSYSNYCRDRNRSSSAQKVLVKGLTRGLKNQKDVDMLWRELLSLMRLTSADLTMEGLYEAINDQLGEKASELSKPTDGLTLEEPMDDSIETTMEVEAIGEIENHSGGSSSSSSSNGSGGAYIKQEPIGTVERDDRMDVTDTIGGQVEAKVSERIEGAGSKSLSSPKIIEDTRSLLMMVQEKIVSGVFDVVNIHSKLYAEEVHYDLSTLSDLIDIQGEIEIRKDLINYDPEPMLVVDNNTQEPMELCKKHQKKPPCILVAPDTEPMLSGIKNLNDIDRRLLEEYLDQPLHTISVHSENTPADVILLLVECLWIIQALKEKEFDSWVAKLQKNHADDEHRILGMIAQKLSTAKPNDPLRSKCEAEKKSFYDRCTVQKCVLDAVLNMSNYELLAIQQYTLADIGFPYFTKSFAAHLLNIVGGIDYDKRTLKIIEKQKLLIGAVLSLKIGMEDSVCPPRMERLFTGRPVNLVNTSGREGANTEGNLKRRRDDTPQPPTIPGNLQQPPRPPPRPPIHQYRGGPGPPPPFQQQSGPHGHPSSFMQHPPRPNMGPGHGDGPGGPWMLPHDGPAPPPRAPPPSQQQQPPADKKSAMLAKLAGMLKNAKK